MRLNTIKPAAGSRPKGKRVGRGIGCTDGKTCGRGHKGQHARAGGYHKVGFEGGQMPLQRRLPKAGFRSGVSRYVAEVRLHELAKAAEGDVVDVLALAQAGVIPHHIKRVRVMASGELNRAIKVRGLELTKGARAAIEAAGGSIED